jgi:hypothetical protein
MQTPQDKLPVASDVRMRTALAPASHIGAVCTMRYALNVMT